MRFSYLKWGEGDCFLLDFKMKLVNGKVGDWYKLVSVLCLLLF